MENKDPNFKDEILVRIVKYVNQESFKDFPITLTVKGMLITGQLCSRKKYLKEEWKDALDLEPAEEESPDYIHLKDVRIFTSGRDPIPTTDGTWWRGKISSVDGFIFGRILIK